MTDSIHRILSGQALTRKELKWAGVIVVLWILIDLIQFADFVWEKFNGACK